MTYLKKPPTLAAHSTIRFRNFVKSAIPPSTSRIVEAVSVAEETLELRPVDSGGIEAESRALILDNLRGNRYGTMADGYFGEVEVSSASLATMRDRIEAVVHSLPRKGRLEPSRDSSTWRFRCGARP